MRYPHDMTQSAEFLRMTLKRMAMHEASLNPFNFSVWYEYVSGVNAALRQDMDTILSEGSRLDDEMIEKLYRRYVSEVDLETAQRVGENIGHLVERVSESAARAGAQADLFGGSLGQLYSQLSGKVGSPEDLAGAVGEMIRDTQVMQQAIGTLQEQLEERTREAELLRQEVVRARQEALIDGLTGLINRKGFNQALAECLEQSCDRVPGPCLLMIDLDHFKKVNDSYGHVFGDRVLSKVGQILKANIKGRDTAARFGGEEFVVILPQTASAGAARLAEVLRTILFSSRIKRVGESEVFIGNISTSIGVAEYIAGESADAFVTRADRALYAAKSQGRNRVCVATEAMQGA